jgi:hypothetical protein
LPPAYNIYRLSSTIYAKICVLLPGRDQRAAAYDNRSFQERNQALAEQIAAHQYLTGDGNQTKDLDVAWFMVCRN